MQVWTLWPFGAKTRLIVSANHLRVLIETLLSVLAIPSVFELLAGNSAEFRLALLIGHLVEVITKTPFGTKPALGVIFAWNGFR